MKKFNELTGYNDNKFVKVNHVFIDGEGSFYETKEIARENNYKTGNEVGLHIISIIFEGIEVYREAQTNVFN